MPPPVVLLHGFTTSSARTWGENGWFDLLADAGRQAVGIDLLGHGTAPKPHETEAYADLERLVLAEFPPGPVDAVGFSLGARVLLTLAAADAGRFRRIVTLGVGANLLGGGHSDRIARAVEGRADPDDPVARYFDRLASVGGNDRRALAACMRSPRPPLNPERLARVTVPVLVLIGEHDFAGPGEPLAEALPQARLVTLPGVDHFFIPKQFGAQSAALDFLDAP